MSFVCFPAICIWQFSKYKSQLIGVKISKKVSVVALGTPSLFGPKGADNPFFSCAEYSSDELHMALNYYRPKPLCLLQKHRKLLTSRHYVGSTAMCILVD